MATTFPALTQLRSVFGETPRYSAASEIRRKSDSFFTSALPASATQSVQPYKPYQSSLYLPGRGRQVPWVCQRRLGLRRLPGPQLLCAARPLFQVCLTSHRYVIFCTVMNYFDTIKAALDTSFAGICRHLNVNSKEAYRLVAQHLATMSKEWFTGDTPNIAYEDPLCRFAYLYCHTAANANLCEVAIRLSPKVCRLTGKNGQYVPSSPGGCSDGQEKAKAGWSILKRWVATDVTTNPIWKGKQGSDWRD
jgi:hypothetical protein